MTGLIGSFRYHPDVPVENLATIATVGPASLSDHGPDTKGEWHSSDGLCRLAAHPSHSHCGRFTLVFNGAIYNHLEVRHVLRFSSWRGETDRETLVEGLAQRGPALLLGLRGVFAFADYGHHKQQLLLERLEHLSSSGLLDPAWIRAQWQGFEAGALHWNRAWSLVVLGEFARRNQGAR